MLWLLILIIFGTDCFGYKMLIYNKYNLSQGFKSVIEWSLLMYNFIIDKKVSDEQHQFQNLYHEN